jgi:sec-independent protein translocase protein TatB
MFDVGFSELLVIAVVALLVLGPERLPKAARFAGLWVRRARAQWNSVKAEFERDLADDELRRTLHDTRESLREAQASLREAGSNLQRDFQGASDELMRGPTPEPREPREPRAALPAAAAATPTATQPFDASAPALGATAPVEPPADNAPAQPATDDDAFDPDPDPEVSLHAPMEDPPPPMDEDEDDALSEPSHRPPEPDQDAADAPQR